MLVVTIYTCISPYVSIGYPSHTYDTLLFQ